MGAFSYRAIDVKGRTRSGVVEAGSAAGARRTLRERDLMPISLQASSANAGAAKMGLRLDRILPGINGKSLALITRQLATLTGSGVRIEDALGTLADQSAPRAAALLLALRAEIAEGRPMSQALAQHPRVFSNFYCASVAAAEDTNRLSPVFGHLAEQIETQQRNRQSIQLALLYPAMLAAVSLLVILVLLTYVVPDIARAFTARGEELPFLTRAMIALGESVAAYGWTLPLLIAIPAAAAQRWLIVDGNRLRWHRFLAKFRLTRGPMRLLASARFAGILSTTIQSGVDLPRALSAAQDATGNLFIRQQIGGVVSRIEEGATLHRAMTEAACFPPMLLAMVASGEASADLGSSLSRAAADQQREVDTWVATLVALVEPGVLLLMGGIVLLMVLSILLPIVGLNDLAGSGL